MLSSDTAIAWSSVLREGYIDVMKTDFFPSFFVYVRVGFFSADCDKKYTPAETLQREYGHQVNEDPYKKNRVKEEKKIAHNVKDDTEKHLTCRGCLKK